MTKTNGIISKEEKENPNLLFIYYLDKKRGLISISQFNIENISSKSAVLPINVIQFDKLQIRPFEKTIPFYSGNPLQKEQVKHKMTSYNLNYVPTEREFYNQLTLEEKREWNALSSEDKQFNLELISSEGQESLKGLCKKLDSCIEKVEKLTLFGI